MQLQQPYIQNTNNQTNNQLGDQQPNLNQVQIAQQQVRVQQDVQRIRTLRIARMQRVVCRGIIILVVLGVLTTVIVTPIVVIHNQTYINESLYPGKLTGNINCSTLIKAKLNWNRAVDIDLSVEEPNLTLVNYQRPQGTFGSLHNDIRYGPAQQRYTANCSQTGRWRFYSKAYYSQQPVPIIYSLEIGATNYTRQYNLSSGQIKQIYTMIVTQDLQSQSWYFTVQPTQI